MRQLILVFFILFGLSSILYADGLEYYAIKKQDGSVAFMTFIPGNGKTIDQVIVDAGYSGFPYMKVNKSSLPPESDIDFWVFSGNQIIIDQNKKQADKDAKDLKKQKVKDLKIKLNLSDDDIKTLKDALNA